MNGTTKAWVSEGALILLFSCVNMTVNMSNFLATLLKIYVYYYTPLASTDGSNVHIDFLHLPIHSSLLDSAPSHVSIRDSTPSHVSMLIPYNNWFTKRETIDPLFNLILN